MARPAPTDWAVMYSATGRPRRSGGKLSEISDRAQGASVASPMPTPTRASSRWPKFRARPDAAVARDQSATPAATSVVRRVRSASQPSGSPRVA